MEPLRIGFLGAGGFARHTIYPALHLAPVALQAVCDADEHRAKDAAGKFGTGRYYTDRHEMFEKEDLEAVIICMGPDPRQSLVLETLAAGYHVFVPKPPCPLSRGNYCFGRNRRKTRQDAHGELPTAVQSRCPRGKADHANRILRYTHATFLLVL